MCMKGRKRKGKHVMLTTHLHHNAQDLMSELVGFHVRRDLIVGRGLRRPVEASKTRKRNQIGKDSAS
jgi:hypothetical protein